MKSTINLIWQDNPHALKLLEYDWIYSLLQNFEVKIWFDDAYEICLDDAIVVSLGGSKRQSHQIENYLKRFKQHNFKVGAIHLGDEWCTNAIDFYRDVDFIFRQYYRQEAYLKNPQCFY
jgi:hypothetical protein